MENDLVKMKLIFEEVYNKGIWKTKNIKSFSGKGSEITNCKNFIKFLNKFIKDNQINSLYDFGCGDCEGIKELDFKNINYYGCDISNKAINLAKKNLFNKENVEFFENNNLEIKGNYDLLLVKHVFGHWLNVKDNGLKGLNCKSDHLITTFLDKNIHKFKYIIINDHIDDRIIKFFPDNFNFKKLVFNSYNNKFNSLYIYSSDNYNHQ